MFVHSIATTCLQDKDGDELMNGDALPLNTAAAGLADLKGAVAAPEAAAASPDATAAASDTASASLETTEASITTKKPLKKSRS